MANGTGLLGIKKLMRRGFFVCLLVLLLPACGQQGSLYLPPEEDENKTKTIKQTKSAAVRVYRTEKL